MFRVEKPPKAFVPDEKKMRVDIAEYKAMGFDSIATFACFLREDYRELYGDVDVTPFAKAVEG